MHGHGEAMTVPASAQKEVAELLSPTCSLGINTRLQKVLGILESHGLLYTRSLTPAAFLCHPQNRGGSMINGFNAHRKGNEILACGVKPDLLAPNSLAVEMALDASQREAQIQANKKMVQEAHGLLAAVKGDERFLTLANSHFVQWAKAIDNGCKGPGQAQVVASEDMKVLITQGWAWQVISNEAERIWPTLPAFAAMAMNSHNSNQIASNELECMMQLAALYQGGLNMDEAILAVQHSAPACKAYLDDVAYFCKMYSGGSSFPLLVCLDHFCTCASIY